MHKANLCKHRDRFVNELVVDHKLLAILQKNGILMEEMMETIQVCFCQQTGESIVVCSSLL